MMLANPLLIALGLLGGGRPSWAQSGSLIDEDFANGRYWPRPVAVELVDTRASTKFVTGASGALTSIAANALPISNAGMLIESVATNLGLQSQTLNNAS